MPYGRTAPKMSRPSYGGTTRRSNIRASNARYARAKIVSTRRAPVARMMKSVALKQCETKRSTFQQEDRQLAHNVTDYVPNFLRTSQGLQNPSGVQPEGNRVGQEVIGRGVAFKFWISNKADRPNVMYKIFIFQYPTRYVENNPLQDTLFWQGGDGQGSTMNRMIDHAAVNRVKLLATRIIKPAHEANYSSNNEQQREKSHLVDIYVKLNNRKIMYNENDGTQPMFNDIGFAIVAYDAFGTAMTDVLASYAYNARFYYKDP